MNGWLGWVLFAYILFPFIIALFAARRIQSVTDFLLAGRRLHFVLIALSLFASWFGAETVMGTAGGAANNGLYVGREDPFGYTLCLILTAILLAFRMRAGNYMTISDMFRERYGVAAEKLSAVIMIPTSLLWAAAQILAFITIFSFVTQWPVEIALLITLTIVVGYTCLGGMMGDIFIDSIMAFAIIIGLSVLFLDVMGEAGGIVPALQSVDPARMNFFATDENFWAQLDAWTLPVLGSLVAQESMSRLLSARSPSDARKACLLGAGIYFVVGLMPLLIGLAGSTRIGPVADSDMFILTLAQEMLPPVLYVVFLIALLSAILTTMDTTLMAATSLAGRNLVLPMLREAGERKKLMACRIIVAAVGVFCSYVAIAGGSIFSLVEMASSFGAGGFLVCVLAGLCTRFGGKLTALATLAAGVVLTIVADYILEVEAPFLAALAGCITVFAITAAIESSMEKPPPVTSA
jgi:Na+/proline symporter